jgi:hypothetical protein
MLIDHKDGNPANNRIENLRIASYEDNNRNRKAPRTSGLGVKGVTVHSQSGKYRVRVPVGGKLRSFGCYDSLELAELVAREAREKYHGEFCNHG